MSATPDSETEYLQPGFNANSLTIPKLRGILLAHDVSYSSNAKKGQLVDLFDQEVAPQAQRLLNARSRTKRSTRGIVDVPSSAEASVDGEESDEEPRPIRTPRMTARSTVSRSTAETSPERSSTARSSRAGSSRLSHASDAPSDSTTRKSSAGARRTRKGLTTPAVKEESEDELPWQREKESSVTGFSSENVFQQGSSPLPDARSSGDEKRRRTTGTISSTEKKPRSTTRRKTDSVVQENGRAVSSAKRSRTPKSRSSSRKLETEDGEELDDTVLPGEEFTPDEQQELEIAQQDGTLTIPARNQRAKRLGSIARVAPLAILVGLLGGLGTVWRQEKIAVGFCGVGHPSTTLAGLEIPDWARDVVQPQCEPCPPHAYCYSDLQASCEEDFVLVPHPLSVGGLVPLPPTCEPDGEKARKVKAVADRAMEELRQRNAKFQCGELRDENGKKAYTPEIKEEVLKAQVSSRRRKGMTQEEFEELWHSALGELMDRDEIIADVDSTTTSPYRTLRSTSLACIPLGCAIRRSVRLAVARHLGKLIAALAIFAAAAYAYTSVLSNREMESRAKQLAGFALERLAQQALWAYDDEQDGEDAYIGVAQLRDDVLRDEFSASRRKKLWERVQRKVEENANVRSMVREDTRSGEVGRVWQWIGAVGALIEDGEASARRSKRKSNRVSFGPIMGSSEINTPTGRTEMREVHWEEGRPIY